MKKFFLFLLLPIFFWGCEKSYNDVVNPNTAQYQVVSTGVESANSDSTIIYSPLDSLVTIRIKLNSSKDINGIFCNIFSPDGNQLNDSPVNLYDNGLAEDGDASKGDNIFSNKYPLSGSYPVGQYTVKFYITDMNNETNQAAVQNFKYDNGQSNQPPQISNLIAPDTVKVADPKSVILMTLNVSDPNGSNDIQSVYFISYKPDGSTSNQKNIMLDDGNFNIDGDQKAGDGIFSILIEVTPQNAKGTYRFDFQAVDRGGKQSNLISHNIVIQ